MARDRTKRGPMAVPRRFLTRALALAAILVVGAATWGMQASGALQPKDVAYDWALPRGFPPAEGAREQPHEPGEGVDRAQALL